MAVEREQASWVRLNAGLTLGTGGENWDCQTVQMRQLCRVVESSELSSEEVVITKRAWRS